MLPAGNENVIIFNFSVPIPTLPPPNRRCLHRSSPSARAKASYACRRLRRHLDPSSRGVRMAPRRSPCSPSCSRSCSASLLAAARPAPAPRASRPRRPPRPASASSTSPAGGVILKANVVAPAAAGRYPAVILPSSWGLNDLEYLAQAKTLAARGYVVVSYTPRGWWLSGGEIDTAGPRGHGRPVPGARLDDRQHGRRPGPHRRGRHLVRRRDQPARLGVRPADPGGRHDERLDRPGLLALRRLDPPPAGARAAQGGRRPARQPRPGADRQARRLRRQPQRRRGAGLGPRPAPRRPTSTPSTPTGRPC